MSDRVVLLNRGRIEQMGTPEELYDEPATRFAAEFIGEANLIEGRSWRPTAGATVARRHCRAAIAMTRSRRDRGACGGRRRLRHDPARADRARRRAARAARSPSTATVGQAGVFRRASITFELRTDHGLNCSVCSKPSLAEYRALSPGDRVWAIVRELPRAAARRRRRGLRCEASGRFGAAPAGADRGALSRSSCSRPISFFLVMSVFRYSALDALDAGVTGENFARLLVRSVPSRDHRCGRSRSRCCPTVGCLVARVSARLVSGAHDERVARRADVPGDRAADDRRDRADLWLDRAARQRGHGQLACCAVSA